MKNQIHQTHSYSQSRLYSNESSYYHNSMLREVIATGCDYKISYALDNLINAYNTYQISDKKLDDIINFQDKYEDAPPHAKNTPLHAILALPLKNPLTESARTNLVEKLLQLKPNLEAVDWCGQTPLFNAVHFDHQYLTKLLIDSGAKINICNRNGEPPLFTALRLGNLEMVNLLLDTGAKAHYIDKFGNGCFHLLSWINFQNDSIGKKALLAKDICQKLKDKGAKIEQLNEDGRTPLFDAVELEAKIVVHFLVNVGANLDRVDNFGKTPRNLAEKINNKNIDKIIHNYEEVPLSLNPEVRSILTREPDNKGREQKLISYFIDPKFTEPKYPLNGVDVLGKMEESGGD